MDSTVFTQRLSCDVALVNEWLDKYMPDDTKEIINIVESMNYSVKAGGKRLRPIIMYETYRLFGGEGDSIERFACALECIHTYSLVHDDLPAMDNDMLRRGIPTTHAKYGEAIGILAGDALLTYAFELILSDTIPKPQFAPNIIKAAGIMAKYAGYYGMIGGQVLDLEAEKGSDITMAKLRRIFELKTGRLLQAGFCVGAILAGCDDENTLADMNALGEAVGIAFQIQDDILDVTGDEISLGKPIGSDERNSKTTSVTLLGLEGAKDAAREYTSKAIDIINKYDSNDGFINALIGSLLDRSI